MAVTMWTQEFWKAVAERAFKTFLYSAIGIAGMDGIAVGTNIRDINWPLIASGIGIAAIASVCGSILTGLATGGEVSLVDAERVVTGTADDPPLPRHALPDDHYSTDGDSA